MTDSSPRLPRPGTARVGCPRQMRATKVGNNAALEHGRACCGRLDALRLPAPCKRAGGRGRRCMCGRWPLCGDTRMAARQAGARARRRHDTQFAASRKQQRTGRAGELVSPKWPRGRQGRRRSPRNAGVPSVPRPCCWQRMRPLLRSAGEPMSQAALRMIALLPTGSCVMPKRRSTGRWRRRQTAKVLSGREAWALRVCARLRRTWCVVCVLLA